VNAGSRGEPNAPRIGASADLREVGAAPRFGDWANLDKTRQELAVCEQVEQL